MFARRLSSVPDRRDLPDLGEREPGGLGVLDEPHPICCPFWVGAVAGWCAVRVGNEPLGFVEAESVEVPSQPAAMVEVAPGGVIDPADVPESVAVLYRAAHAHSDIFEAVPCFCGCEAMLGHRHLLDCFARPDGGWEAHALGCGVCLGEAQQVEDLLAEGITDPGEIRAAVVSRWGDPYQ